MARSPSLTKSLTKTPTPSLTPIYLHPHSPLSPHSLSLSSSVKRTKKFKFITILRTCTLKVKRKTKLKMKSEIFFKWFVREFFLEKHLFFVWVCSTWDNLLKVLKDKIGMGFLSLGPFPNRPLRFSRILIWKLGMLPYAWPWH